MLLSSHAARSRVSARSAQTTRSVVSIRFLVFDSLSTRGTHENDGYVLSTRYLALSTAAQMSRCPLETRLGSRYSVLAWFPARSSEVVLPLDSARSALLGAFVLVGSFPQNGALPGYDSIDCTVLARYSTRPVLAALS